MSSERARLEEIVRETREEIRRGEYRNTNNNNKVRDVVRNTSKNKEQDRLLNVRLRGVREFEGETLTDVVRELVSDLGVDLSKLTVSGRDGEQRASSRDSRHIILRCADLSTKEHLLALADDEKLKGKLKGKGISFAPDLTREQLRAELQGRQLLLYGVEDLYNDKRDKRDDRYFLQGIIKRISWDSKPEEESGQKPEEWPEEKPDQNLKPEESLQNLKPEQEESDPNPKQEESDPNPKQEESVPDSNPKQEESDPNLKQEEEEEEPKEEDVIWNGIQSFERVGEASKASHRPILITFWKLEYKNLFRQRARFHFRTFKMHAVGDAGVPQSDQRQMMARIAPDITTKLRIQALNGEQQLLLKGVADLGEWEDDRYLLERRIRQISSEEPEVENKILRGIQSYRRVGELDASGQPRPILITFRSPEAKNLFRERMKVLTIYGVQDVPQKKEKKPR